MARVEVLHENHDRPKARRKASKHVGDCREATGRGGHRDDLKLTLFG
jgi:hypothetical protein